VPNRQGGAGNAVPPPQRCGAPRARPSAKDSRQSPTRQSPISKIDGGRPPPTRTAARVAKRATSAPSVLDAAASCAQLCAASASSIARLPPPTDTRQNSVVAARRGSDSKVSTKPPAVSTVHDGAAGQSTSVVAARRSSDSMVSAKPLAVSTVAGRRASDSNVSTKPPAVYTVYDDAAGQSTSVVAGRRASDSPVSAKVSKESLSVTNVDDGVSQSSAIVVGRRPSDTKISANDSNQSLAVATVDGGVASPSTAAAAATDGAGAAASEINAPGGGEIFREASASSSIQGASYSATALPQTAVLPDGHASDTTVSAKDSMQSLTDAAEHLASLLKQAADAIDVTGVAESDTDVASDGDLFDAPSLIAQESSSSISTLPQAFVDDDDNFLTSHTLAGGADFDRRKFETIVEEEPVSGSEIESLPGSDWEFTEVERNISRGNFVDRYPKSDAAANLRQQRLLRPQESTSSIDSKSSLGDNAYLLPSRRCRGTIPGSSERRSRDLLPSVSNITMQSNSGHSLAGASDSLSSTPSKTSRQKIANRSAQHRGSLIPVRRNIPTKDDGFGEPQPETEFCSDDEDGIDDVLQGDEVEQDETASNGWDNDGDYEDEEKEEEGEEEEREEEVDTQLIAAQLRQLSSVMDRKPPIHPPTSAQRPASPVVTKPPPEQAKRVGKAEKPVPSPSSIRSLRTQRGGLTARPARGRMHAQPTISSIARETAHKGPSFTSKRPPSTYKSTDSSAVDGPSSVIGSRNRPQLDDRSSKVSDAGKPSVRGGTHAGMRGRPARGGTRSTSGRVLGAAARQPRSSGSSTASEQKGGDWSDEPLNDDVQTRGDSDIASRRPADLSKLAPCLQGPDGTSGVRSRTTRSASPAPRRGGPGSAAGPRQGDAPSGSGSGSSSGGGGGGGGGGQTVEDVYVEAMWLDADGRVSGRSSLEWRQELARIIDSLRHQMRSRSGGKPAAARVGLVTDQDSEEYSRFSPVAVPVAAQKKAKR